MLCQYSAVSAAPRTVLKFIVYCTANVTVYLLKYQSLINPDLNHVY